MRLLTTPPREDKDEGLGLVGDLSRDGGGERLGERFSGLRRSLLERDDRLDRFD